MLAQIATGTISPTTWIAIAIAVILILAIVWYATRKRRSEHLRKQFGPEYDRYVRTIGSQSKAEEDLAARERRHRKLDIKPLAPDARQRYQDEWRKLQSEFVDAPEAAIRKADTLIQSVMRDRGYPTGDFDRQTEDLSVDHSRVLDDYRSAHEISERSVNGSASTEELRQAVISYRSLFDSLVGTQAVTGER